MKYEIREAKRLFQVALAFLLACACDFLFAGVRPYEMEWAGRTKDDRPVVLPLVSADGWMCKAQDVTAVFTTAC